MKQIKQYSIDRLNDFKDEYGYNFKDGHGYEIDINDDDIFIGNNYHGSDEGFWVIGDYSYTIETYQYDSRFINGLSTSIGSQNKILYRKIYYL